MPWAAVTARARRSALPSAGDASAATAPSPPASPSEDEPQPDASRTAARRARTSGSVARRKVFFSGSAVWLRLIGTGPDLLESPNGPGTPDHYGLNLSRRRSLTTFA